MQERVKPQSNEFPDVIVQFNIEQGHLGIGLEPSVDVPSKHMIDQIYGGVPYLTEIGRLFNARANELGWDTQEFEDSDAEAKFNACLGRVILDAVTGSSSSGNGWWTWLDRPSANRLIRLIRKARDTTFGRDE